MEKSHWGDDISEILPKEQIYNRVAYLDLQIDRQLEMNCGEEASASSMMHFELVDYGDLLSKTPTTDLGILAAKIIIWRRLCTEQFDGSTESKLVISVFKDLENILDLPMPCHIDDIIPSALIGDFA